MNLHDVIRELIDVAAGTIAHLPPERAAELHAAVNESEDAAAVKVDGPDVAPEPVPVAGQRAAVVAPADYSYEQAADGTTSVQAEPARNI